MNTEYLVFEKAVDAKYEYWYRHGSIHDNLKDAMEDLLNKQDRYEKYGRVFRLKFRIISDWKEL